jgi:hypothetical protein
MRAERKEDEGADQRAERARGRDRGRTCATRPFAFSPARSASTIALLLLHQPSQHVVRASSTATLRFDHQLSTARQLRGRSEAPTRAAGSSALAPFSPVPSSFIRAPSPIRARDAISPISVRQRAQPPLYWSVRRCRPPCAPDRALNVPRPRAHLFSSSVPRTLSRASSTSSAHEDAWPRADARGRLMTHTSEQDTTAFARWMAGSEDAYIRVKAAG